MYMLYLIVMGITNCIKESKQFKLRLINNLFVFICIIKLILIIDHAIFQINYKTC